MERLHSWGTGRGIVPGACHLSSLLAFLLLLVMPVPRVAKESIRLRPLRVAAISSPGESLKKREAIGYNEVT